MNQDDRVERQLGKRVVAIGARISALVEKLETQPGAGSEPVRQELQDLASRQEALGARVQALDEGDDSGDQAELQEALAQLSTRVDEISERLK